jgi:predicted DNA-binding protein
VPDPESTDRRAARSIIVRLPDAAHDKLDRFCARAGIAPEQYVEDVLVTKIEELP